MSSGSETRSPRRRAVRGDGRPGRAWVLMYHSIADDTVDPLGVTVRPDRFHRQLRWLRDRGLRGVDMTTLLARLARTGHARGLVGLTFDDGYADFASTAVPILARFGFTATVYVLADRLGGVNDWDRPGPVKPLLRAEQVREVAEAGMEVGSHGLRHRSLCALSAAELAAEVGASRRALLELTGRPVDGFAYPYGHAGAREVRAVVEAGYRHGCAVGRPAPGTQAVSPVHAVARSHIGSADLGPRLAAKWARHRLLWGSR